MFRHLVVAIAVAILAQPLQNPAGAQRQGGQGPAGRGDGQGRPGGLGGLCGRGAEAHPVGTSIIRGRIVAADTGTPVRRAQVRATSSTGRGARLVTTDADGRFELRDLPDGRWQVSASKGGFITQQFGQRHAFEQAVPIDLMEGQRFTADFRLLRGGVITGQVFDETGDPVTGARVQVMRSQMRQGRRQLVSAGTADQTDDRGAYRIFGLPPADYYISGNLRAAPLDSTEDAVIYAPTYTVRALPPGQRYLAVAVDYLEQGEQQDPEFLERIRSRASSVSLSDGDQKALDLTLVKR
jgi:hypothetical protein